MHDAPVPPDASMLQACTATVPHGRHGPLEGLA
jgi:hypothetical protein